MEIIYTYFTTANSTLLVTADITSIHVKYKFIIIPGIAQHRGTTHNSIKFFGSPLGLTVPFVVSPVIRELRQWFV